jgi:PAS domain S-box-containing protein
VLLDYNMPLMDGLTLAGELRAAFAYLPIILMTSVGDEMLAAEALRGGVSDYLPKSKINVQAFRLVVDRSIRTCRQSKLVDDQRNELTIFAHALAHDFKQPAHQIAAIAQLISGEPADGAGQLATLRAVAAAGRRFADEHLVQMEARYRGLLEAAPDAMVVVNEAGDIVLLNLQAEKQFGYRRDELVGQAVTNIIPVGFAERLLADGARTAAEALAQQIGTGIELSGRRKDGSEFPIELMLSPLESAEGILVTAAIRDGTARHEAVEALKQRLVLERTAVELTRSNDDLKEFAYVAAHDLQEPLRMVSSYTQLLADRYRGQLDADAERYIEFAVDGTRRMQLLITDLLAYCQIGTAQQDLRESSTEDALGRALMNLKGAIEESGGTVTHGALPTLIADPAQLTQLFQNIIGNAMKYRSALPPHVHVSAERTAAHEWVFSMRDNGLGIDPIYSEKIFLMFQRLHGRSEFTGTGIGLTLCRKIAERHGGRMWVESRLGDGATFYLALPETCSMSATKAMNTLN